MDRSSIIDDQPASERRALVLYAAPSGHTHLIGDAIGERLRTLGLVVELGDALAGVMPSPMDYDAVVLVVPVGFTRGIHALATYVAQNRAGLGEVPTALVSVCPPEPGHQHPQDHVEEFERLGGWRPNVVAAVTCGHAHGAFRDGLARGVMHYFGSLTTPDDRASVDWSVVTAIADSIASRLVDEAATRPS